MTLFFSEKTGGFYDSAIHGSPMLTIVDPKFKWPTIDVPDPHWVATNEDPEAVAPLIQVLDPAVSPPMVDIPNPDCQIPADAVEITPEHHAELGAGSALGKVIVVGADGLPTLQDPSPLSGNDLVKDQIASLEAEITDRRLREAVLGTDGGWLKNQDAEISALRSRLT